MKFTERVERGQIAIKEGVLGQEYQSLAFNVAELLTSVLHLCEQRNIDFEAQLQIARDIHAEERPEKPEKKYQRQARES